MELTRISQGMRKVLSLKRCGAVIVAAGSASRMGGIDKVMAPLRGEPVILRTVRAFQETDAIREIVIVTREDLIMPVSDLCAGLDKVKAVVVGGGSRQESNGPLFSGRDQGQYLQAGKIRSRGKRSSGVFFL